MSLQPDEVFRIARLARLRVEADEAPRYVRELTSILDLVARMDAVDTSAVEPMAHPLDMMQRLRPDAVSEPEARERFQADAPAVAAGLYLVPKVIE